MHIINGLDDDGVALDREGCVVAHHGRVLDGPHVMFVVIIIAVLGSDEAVCPALGIIMVVVQRVTQGVTEVMMKLLHLVLIEFEVFLFLTLELIDRIDALAALDWRSDTGLESNMIRVSTCIRTDIIIIEIAHLVSVYLYWLPRLDILVTGNGVPGEAIAQVEGRHATMSPITDACKSSEQTKSPHEVDDIAEAYRSSRTNLMAHLPDRFPQQDDGGNRPSN